MDIATRIKAVRVKKGLSQQALADKLGVSQSSIANYEKGRSPDSEFIKSFCDKMGVTADWLVFGEDPKDAKSADVGGSYFHNKLDLHDDSIENPPTRWRKKSEESFATRIRFLRSHHDVAEFASMISVDESEVRAYEKGERFPSVETLNIICLVFNVTTDWLFFGEAALSTSLIPKMQSELLRKRASSQIMKLQENLIQAYKEIGDLKDSASDLKVELATLKTKNEQLEREKDRLLERILELERRPSAASATPAPDAPEANPTNEKTRIHFSVPISNDSNNQPPKP